MISSSKKDPETLLKDHGLKVTNQRTEVLKAFLNKKKVLSLSNLLQTLGDSFDRITLYRTLNTFEEHGLIHKIPDKSGSASYALCRHDSVHHQHVDNHIHFKCEDCDRTYCLEEVLIPLIKLNPKLKPLKYNFLIEGICERCNKN